MIGVAKLTSNTVVLNPKSGNAVSLLAGEDVPKWAESLIGDHLLDEPKASRKASAPDGSLPPKSGNGSGKEAWLAHARSEEVAAQLAAAEVEIADDANRDEIIAALEKAGVPTEKQEQ